MEIQELIDRLEQALETTGDSPVVFGIKDRYLLDVTDVMVEYEPESGRHTIWIEVKDF